MSKKYRGKTCAYCASATATTADHVFAREFFLASARDGLPKVPACVACNRDKSKLEHYATAVVPFGGRHAAAKTALETMVPGRLRRNASLLRGLQEGQTRVWVQGGEDALVVPSIAIPIDPQRLRRLYQYIAQGLCCHHWNLRLPPEAQWQTAFLTAEGDKRLLSGIRAGAAARASADLANGAVRYEGLQAASDPHAVVWRISLLGGVTFASDDPADGVCSSVAAFTTGALPIADLSK
jgi:hypothetical protein